MERTFQEQASEVYGGSKPFVLVDTDGKVSSGSALKDDPLLILSGSFNPLHTGHRKLMEAASGLPKMSGVFELSVHNADKSSISLSELERRVAQFKAFSPVLVTALPLFVDKARRFPNSVFVMGADTLERIVDPSYYGNGMEGAETLEEVLEQTKCRLIVAGRKGKDGRFVNPKDVAVPAGVREKIEVLSESAFREDISSSSILQAKGNSSGSKH